MEGLGNNSVILLALCLLFSLLLIGPLMWMCFLNLTYRLRKFQRSQQVKDQVGSMERGLASMRTEVASLVSKVTWLEGQLAVAECSSEVHLVAPPTYVESQREVERRGSNQVVNQPQPVAVSRRGGDERQDLEEVVERLLASSEENVEEPPPLAPRGGERQAPPPVERRTAIVKAERRDGSLEFEKERRGRDFENESTIPRTTRLSTVALERNEGAIQ